MRYQITVIIFGVIIGLFPLVHLPTAWEAVLHICIAVLLISTGIIIHQHRNRPSSPHTVQKTSPTPAKTFEEKYSMPATTSLENSTSIENPLAQTTESSSVSLAAESVAVKPRRRVIRS